MLVTFPRHVVSTRSLLSYHSFLLPDTLFFICKRDIQRVRWNRTTSTFSNRLYFSENDFYFLMDENIYYYIPNNYVPISYEYNISKIGNTERIEGRSNLLFVPLLFDESNLCLNRYRAAFQFIENHMSSERWKVGAIWYASRWIYEARRRGNTGSTPDRWENGMRGHLLVSE